MARKRHFTTAQAARILGVHVETVRRRIRDGKFPEFYQIGGVGPFRISPEDLDKIQCIDSGGAVKEG